MIDNKDTILRLLGELNREFEKLSDNEYISIISSFEGVDEKRKEFSANFNNTTRFDKVEFNTNEVNIRKVE